MRYLDIFCGLILAVFAAAWLLPGPSEPPWVAGDRVADVDRLVAHFDQLVFGRNPGYRVRKWVQPIRISLHGAGADRWRPAVEMNAAMLARITGWPIGVFDDEPWRGNLEVTFVERAGMYDVTTQYGNWMDRERLAETVEGAGGLAIVVPRRATRISRGAVIVDSGLSKESIYRLIPHELVHVLGMGNHADIPGPSIMNARHKIATLSINDRIVLQALYDDRIPPDVVREKALPRAREIIAELVAEARSAAPVPAD